MLSGKPRRFISVIMAVIFISSTMLTLSVSLLSDMTDVAAPRVPTEKTPIPARTLALIAHDPILIDGNSGFTGLNSTTGVTRGSGIESDPYVIEGWEIAWFALDGIVIMNADVCFLVQDCYVHDGLDPSISAAISIYSCSNGTLKNNTCSNCSQGIYIENSAGTIVIDNNCSSNSDVGIVLLASSKNRLANNTCLLNSYYDIELTYSNGNEMANNTCTSTAWQAGIYFALSNNNSLIGNALSSDGNGVLLYESTNNTFAENRFVGSGIFMQGYELRFLDSHSIDTTNTVNGKPIYYVKDQTGMAVPAGAGQILMVNCTDMLIENQNLSWAGVGVELALCTGVTVINCICADNERGIHLVLSSGNNISGNTCLRNDLYGIELLYSDNNNLSDNNCSWNEWAGINIDTCTDNKVTNNTCTNNEWGVEVQLMSGNHLDNNTCSNNSVGIFLIRSSENDLIDNVCMDNWEGVNLSTSNYNRVINNTCLHNGCGIALDQSSGNYLACNTCPSNGHGMYLDQSSGNTLSNNTCGSNTGNGIFLYEQSDDNTLCNNNCSYNSQLGVYVAISDRNSLGANTCNLNAWSGIYMFSSIGSTLVNNTFNLNGGVGIDISLSSNLSMIDNACCLNDWAGILLQSTYTSYLTNNNVSSNNRSGIYVWFSTGNNICANNCSSNGLYGMYFGYSQDNAITLNHLCDNLEYGVYLDAGSGNNRIWNNTFCSNNGADGSYDTDHVQACDNGTGNWWNSASGYGNYWSDWTGPDANMDGIVDMPYNISGSAGSKDFYPLTTTPPEPIPEFVVTPLVAMIFVVIVVLMIGARRRKAE